jgi:hypothetical protein
MSQGLQDLFLMFIKILPKKEISDWSSERGYDEAYFTHFRWAYQALMSYAHEVKNETERY